MNFKKTPELLGIAAPVAAVCSTFSVGAIAAGGGALRLPRALPAGRANCMAGKTAESQKTCLTEAAAALQASRKHNLTSPSRPGRRQRAQALRGAIGRRQEGLPQARGGHRHDRVRQRRRRRRPQGDGHRHPGHAGTSRRDDVRRPRPARPSCLRSPATDRSGSHGDVEVDHRSRLHRVEATVVQLEVGAVDHLQPGRRDQLAPDRGHRLPDLRVQRRAIQRDAEHRHSWPPGSPAR